jgi:hypothetical protein
MFMPAVPPGIPAECLENFQRLLAFPLDTQKRMLEGIERHLVSVAIALEEHPQVNLALAQQIAEQLQQLLSYDESITSPQDQAWIQAAARYFFLNDDGNHDWNSAEGFEDDSAVVLAVSKALARP